jgi:hypothetical protein
VLDWLRAHNHAPYLRGEQGFFVPRWRDHVPEDIKVLVREHHDAIRALLVAVSEPEQQGQETATAVGATPPSPPAAVAPQPEAPKAPAHPYKLPRELWDGCGIYVLNGIPTCSRGDQHAAAIIAGEIRYEEAVAGCRATAQMLSEMAHSQRRR